MKLSEEIKNMINGSDSLNYEYYLDLKKIIPKVEQLEQQNKELVEAFIEKIKIDYGMYKQLMTIEISEKYYKHHRIKENIELIEKITGKKWSEIK